MSENLQYLETLGSADTYNHYPTGWAVAFSTPFQMFKRYSQYSGGTCDPMVISWPKGIKANGEVRHQYHHVTDVVPTILDVIELEMPTTYRGVEQYPVNGVSMRYSFDDADAPTAKKRQYYAMLGTRGIWEDGWKAAAIHAPLSSTGHFDEDKWQLYHVDEDCSESTDLAAEHPEKLKALIDVWFEEAHRNFVLPLATRRAKIRYLLARNGIANASIDSFIEADLDNGLKLFRMFNDGTHGHAGKFSIPQLAALRTRVESAITFMHGLTV